MTVSRNAYNFFRANGGGIVGENAKGALQLARAEEVLRTAQYHNLIEVRWIADFDRDESFVDDWSENDRKAWERTSHTWEACIIVQACYACVQEGRTNAFDCRHSAQVGSLWGIIDASDDYRRVVEAEIALENLETLETILAALPAAEGK